MQREIVMILLFINSYYIKLFILFGIAIDSHHIRKTHEIILFIDGLQALAI